MKLKSILPVLVLLMLLIQTHAQPSRMRLNFDEQWKFQLGDIYAARNAEYNDAAWRTLNLPHDWNIELPFDARYASSTAYLPSGIGWYRKSFEVPASYNGKKANPALDPSDRRPPKRATRPEYKFPRSA